MELWHTRKRRLKLPDMRPHIPFLVTALFITGIVVYTEHLHKNAFFPLAGMLFYLLGACILVCIEGVFSHLSYREMVRRVFSVENINICLVYTGFAGVLVLMHYPFYIAWI